MQSNGVNMQSNGVIFQGTLWGFSIQLVLDLVKAKWRVLTTLGSKQFALIYYKVWKAFKSLPENHWKEFWLAAIASDSNFFRFVGQDHWCRVRWVDNGAHRPLFMGHKQWPTSPKGSWHQSLMLNSRRSWLHLAWAQEPPRNLPSYTMIWGSLHFLHGLPESKGRLFF